MTGYDPVDFRHGLDVLRTRLAELDALGYDDQDRVDRFHAELDGILGRMIDHLAEVAGKSTDAAELILCLASGQYGGHVDLARIEALHNEFVARRAVLHAGEVDKIHAQRRRAATQKRTRKAAHPFTAQQLRDLLHELGMDFGERGLPKRLAEEILNQTGKPITPNPLRRLVTAATRRAPSR